jgi:hypothetical protein
VEKNSEFVKIVIIIIIIIIIKVFYLPTDALYISLRKH